MLSGCGIIDYIYLPPSEDTAQELYENGNDAMREKKYDEAAEYYTKIKDNYPFSPFAIEAELSLADAYFLNKDYPEAANAYQDFESLHPRNPAIPYVLYQLGMSHLNAFISIDRPVTQVQKGLDYFHRLRETYPGSEYAEKALVHMQECRRILAERELYIADVYWRTEKYGAAWQRYAYVKEHFSDIPQAMEYASERASAAYLLYRKQESQTQLEEREGSWKKWFDWL